jgi:hypothetical protein
MNKLSRPNRKGVKMLDKITINLIVEDVNETMEFYRDILTCFELVECDPKEGPLDWAMVKCENVQLMFESKSSISKVIPSFKNNKNGGSLVVYIELDDVKSLYQSIKDKVNIIRDPFCTNYGMLEFIVQDCNGFFIVFAEWIGIRDFFSRSVKKKEIV